LQLTGKISLKLDSNSNFLFEYDRKKCILSTKNLTNFRDINCKFSSFVKDTDNWFENSVMIFLLNNINHYKTDSWSHTVAVERLP